MPAQPSNNLSPRYRAAGVDIDAAQQLIERITPLCKRTYRAGVCDLPHGFAGLFDLSATNYDYQNPMLVSATDGVGSKVKLAAQLNKHDTIGQDLVAMCVNDVLCCGGEPIVFLDYFACGTLHVDVAATVIDGIANACTQAGCALIGGETAEMPGLYRQQEYELAGFAVGLVEKNKQCGAHQVRAGDKILGLASSGLHANGYSLLHAVCDQHPQAWNETVDGQSVAELAIAPTTIYVPGVLQLIREDKIHALAHITGGGIIDNLPRVLPEGLQARLRAWLWPPLFHWLQNKGDISDEEMVRVFNCGIGMVVIVADEHTYEVMRRLKKHDYEPLIIGDVVAQANKPPVFFHP